MGCSAAIHGKNRLTGKRNRGGWPHASMAIQLLQQDSNAAQGMSSLVNFRIKATARDRLKSTTVSLDEIKEGLWEYIAAEDRDKDFDHMAKYGTLHPIDIPDENKFTQRWNDAGWSKANDFVEDFWDFVFGNISHMSAAKRNVFVNLVWAPQKEGFRYEKNPQTNATTRILEDGIPPHPLLAYIKIIFGSDGGESVSADDIQLIPQARYELVVVRPCIEVCACPCIDCSKRVLCTALTFFETQHNMHGVILGRGGLELGATFWGQTELSVRPEP